MPDSKIWIVIPTYWGSTDAGIYDHPTPLDGVSTLPRLLNSLSNFDYSDQYSVLILVSTTDREDEDAAIDRVQEIIKLNQKKIDLNICGPETAREFNRFFIEHGIDLQLNGMQGYAAIRNMQLLYPAAFGAEIIIALDDDEIVASDYLQKALRWVGRAYGGERVVGLAGPYLDETGSRYLKEPEKIRNLLLEKTVLMNQGMKILSENPNAISITPMAFGGNMIFHKDLFTQVGFDPGITRGEDIDYLINARLSGYDFYFDPALTITHLPPRHYESAEYAKLKQDVIRFVYERKKLTVFGLSPEVFEPYPGKLLGEDLLEMAINSLKLVAKPKWIKQFGTPEEIIQYAVDHAEKSVNQYQRFIQDWPAAMGIVGRLRNNV